MSWMQRIASQESREEAREVFDEWLEMKASVNDSVAYIKRCGDVAVLHVKAGEPDTPNVNNHIARDICQNYAGGQNPVRCIDITGVESGVVQLNMLLAELRVNDPREEAADD